MCVHAERDKRDNGVNARAANEPRAAPAEPPRTSQPKDMSNVAAAQSNKRRGKSWVVAIPLVFQTGAFHETS